MITDHCHEFILGGAPVRVSIFSLLLVVALELFHIGLKAPLPLHGTGMVQELHDKTRFLVGYIKYDRTRYRHSDGTRPQRLVTYVHTKRFNLGQG